MNTLERKRNEDNRECLRNSRFVYDIVLFSNDGEELQKLIEELSRESRKVRLKVSMQETKIMLGNPVKE